MESPEAFYENLRLYKRHALCAIAGLAVFLFGVVAGIVTSHDIPLIALVIAGGLWVAAGRLGLRCGRTILTGWSISSGDSEGELTIGEQYTTRELEQMSPHERLGFARRAGFALISIGIFAICLGVFFLVWPLVR
jgi:hypothetical protein